MDFILSVTVSLLSPSLCPVSVHYRIRGSGVGRYRDNGKWDGTRDCTREGGVGAV